MENSKKFHITDLLTVTTDRLLSTRHVEGLYDILNFLTNDYPMTHQLARVSKEVTPWLFEQYPVLNSLEMEWAMTELIENLKIKHQPENIIKDWLNKLISGGFGFKIDEWLKIKPMPEYELKNPIAELFEMTGEEKEIVII